MTGTPRADSAGRRWIEDIPPEGQVQGLYLVRNKRLGLTKRGDPFLSISLADRTGEMEARVWERAEEFSALFEEGDILQIEGNAGSYRGRTQLVLTRLKVFEGEVDPAVFWESAEGDIGEMLRALRETLGEIRNADLKGLVDRFLSDRRFMSDFKRAPAAKNFHHSYLGGLLEHTLALCRMTLQVAGLYPGLDKDLLLTAAFLHDIGKVRELRYDRRIDYTDEGRLLGHIVLGVAMLDEKLAGFKGFPRTLALRLRHLILSHHGEYAFGSPKRPKFLEAFALHLIDDLDAKLNGLGRFMAKDRQEGAWTDFNVLFERYFLKGEILTPTEGKDRNSSAEERQESLFQGT